MKYTPEQYDEILKIIYGKPKFYLINFLNWIFYRKLKIKYSMENKTGDNLEADKIRYAMLQAGTSVKYLPIQIIQPAHNHKADKVKNWKEIKEEAFQLRDFIQNGTFNGHYDKAYAISHAQVSNDPKRFFVINEKIMEGALLKEFGSWCIINAEILQFGAPISIHEACMSFPFRNPKKVDRFANIKGRYQVTFWFGTLRRKTKRLRDVSALIVQHENQHSSGSSIYFEK